MNYEGNQLDSSVWRKLHARNSRRSVREIVSTNIFIGIITVLIFYISLLVSSTPIQSGERVKVDKAIAILETKGFDDEVYYLRYLAKFRGSKNWLNDLTVHENAYATTNYPFMIITLGEDFYTKAEDDTERAMILLHEAQHLQGSDENEAYAYVWKHRQRLGWTLLSHGTTESYITIDLQTRQNAPELFTCSENLFDDCTEGLRAKK